MNKDFIEIIVNIKPWHNLVSEVAERIIHNILLEVIQNGDYRSMPYGDANEFYNKGMKQVVDTEIYSIPLSKCHYDIVFSLINSIIVNAMSNKKFEEDELLVVFKGCEVNGANIDIHIGTDFLKE